MKGSLRSQRSRSNGRLRDLLAYGGHVPQPATFWVVGFVALFLIRPWEVLVPELAVFRLESVALIALALRVFFGSEARWRLTRPTLGILALAAAILLTSMASLDFATSYERLEQVLKLAIFALCSAAVLRTTADVRLVCWGWAGTMLLYQGKALFEYWVNGRGVYRMGFWRLIGIEESFGDPNAFAANSVLLVPILVLLYVTTHRSAERRLIWLAFGLAAVVVVLSGSRGALVASFVTGVLYLLMSQRRAMVLALAATALLVGSLLLPDEIRERYRTIVDPTLNESATESARGRAIGFRKGFDLLRSYPLTGVGPGVFPDSSRYGTWLEYEIIGLQPHSLPGQLAGETGLIGISSFAYFLWVMLSTSRALRRIRSPGDPDLAFLMHLGTSAWISTLLLLATGLWAHNLYAYHWFWTATLLAAASGMQSDGSLEKRVA